jgi:[FeFe] hydrogenase H-cluster maturation GTPase HydF
LDFTLLFNKFKNKAVIMAVSELNETPMSSRPNIVIIGCRNAGKSSFINALTKQDLAIVSNVAGTTADPVYKPMEILPIGPVTLIDTAGLDDLGELGELRVKKTNNCIKTANFVFVIISAETGFTKYDINTINNLIKNNQKFIIVINKSDLNNKIKIPNQYSNLPIFYVSSKTNKGIEQVKQKLGELFPKEIEKKIIADLVNKGDTVILVVPIDSSAPKGRLILPQVQTLRELLDYDCIAVVTKETDLKSALKNLSVPPKLVVTDSQAIEKVAADTPENIMLTTFSILFARYKGDLNYLINGIKILDKLENNDKIIVLEACTHHAMPEDIGRVKIPKWLTDFTGKKLKFDFFAGKEIPDNLEQYTLGIHCGGCMLNQKQMETRIEQFKKLGLPVLNYGIIISYLHNAFPRVLKPIPNVLSYN